MVDNIATIPKVAGNSGLDINSGLYVFALFIFNISKSLLSIIQLSSKPLYQICFLCV